MTRHAPTSMATRRHHAPESLMHTVLITLPSLLSLIAVEGSTAKVTCNGIDPYLRWTQPVSGPVTSVALALHGLNARSQTLIPLIETLSHNGIATLALTLVGHEKPGEAATQSGEQGTRGYEPLLKVHEAHSPTAISEIWLCRPAVLRDAQLCGRERQRQDCMSSDTPWAACSRFYFSPNPKGRASMGPYCLRRPSP